MIFSENLQLWRLKQGLTQEELAAKSGISRPNLAALERGKRECTLTTLHRLAYGLGISPGTLLDQKPQPGRSSLTRHDIDAVARNLLGAGTKLPPPHQKIRNQLLFESAPLLRLAGIQPKPRRQKISPQYQKEAEQIMRRVRKLLPYVISGGKL